MTERGKGIALAVSVTLNVLMAAAIVAGLWMAHQAWRDRIERRSPELYQAARTLPSADQARLRDDMRDAARVARHDFHEAREHRRKAAALGAAPNYDRAAVLKELRDANAAEMRGRAKLDERLTTVFEGLSPQARKSLAPGLEHRSRGMHGDRGRDRGRDHHERGEGPDRDQPPQDASPPAAPAPN